MVNDNSESPSPVAYGTVWVGVLVVVGGGLGWLLQGVGGLGLLVGGAFVAWSLSISLFVLVWLMVRGMVEYRLAE